MMCVPVSVPLVLDWLVDSKCFFRTSGVAGPQGVFGQWLLGGDWRQPSYHWEALPTASELKTQQNVFQRFSLFQFAILDHMTFRHHTLTFVQDGIGWFVTRHGFFAKVLVGFSQTLHLTETCVEGHWWVGGVLSHVEVSSTTQLFLNHKGLLQQLVGETSAQKSFTLFQISAASSLYNNADKVHDFESSTKTLVAA